MRGRRGGILALAALGLCALAGAASAQGPEPEGDYRLGSGDILQLNVLQQPDLDRSLTVRPDGTAVIPRIGPVAIGGLSLLEAEELVRQRLQLYDPGIGEVSLTVVEYNAMRVFVLGAVTRPGSHSFTSPPTLWDAIRAAGGPLPSANLGITRVVHQVPGGTRAEVFDLSSLLTGQGSVPVVQLRPGDTVVVPAVEGQVAQVPAGVGVQVMGAVGQPSTVAIAEPTRLITVLMRAGTPLEDSELGKVWWVHEERPGSYRSTRVNLKLFLEEGSLAGNPLVYPGDTVRVPGRRQGWFSQFLPVFLRTITAGVAIVYAIDRIEN